MEKKLQIAVGKFSFYFYNVINALLFSETTERCKQITPRIMVLSGGYYIDSCLTSREEVGNLLETIRKAAEKGYGILRVSFPF